MTNYRSLVAIAAVSLIGVVGCQGDFLTQGEASQDPNRPTTATRTQLFQGVEANIWNELGGDPARSTGILVQQFTGGISQYQSLNDTYALDAAGFTNGLHSTLYGGGGLVDIQKLQQASVAAHDSIFLGIAQVQEGLLMGTGADLFGNLVYSQSLQNLPNPKLDDQLTVYDSVQKVLAAAIANLNAKPGATNVGPGSSDLVYGGDPIAWQTLAHTLKARFYMHTGKVRQSAYASALTEAQQGIMSDAGNYVGAFTQAAGEQNLYYQFDFLVGRGGYLIPNQGFYQILQSRKDPRATGYFATDSNSATQISNSRLLGPSGQGDFRQPFVTYDENTLIWAEAAYRTGDFGTALTKVNEERAHNKLAAETVANSAGRPLLNEILTDEYISDFQVGVEPFILYQRTCTPNLVPAPGAAASPSGGKIPGRLFYDTSELNTDTSYPAAGSGVNGYRNSATPPSTTSDGTGAACLGQ